MALLQAYVRSRRASNFLDRIEVDARILEIGSGSGWVGEYLRGRGVASFTGVDLVPPADVVGDILDWPALGLQPCSFDVIIAFEVLEHVDCFDACHNLLKSDGILMLTSPLPAWDWLLKLLEDAGINQRRTSPHTNLFDARRVAGFKVVEYRRFAALSQWAILRKHGSRDAARRPQT